MRRPLPLSQLPLFPVTGGTALLAIVVTIAWQAKWDVSALMEDYHVLQFQLWRLLTAILPHADIFHLLFNIYWLWVFGALIESSYGHVRTLLLFIVLAIGSGAAEFAILDGGVGLSGVGYGLFGFLWVMSRYSVRFEDAIDQNTVALFVGWFFLCIVLTYSGALPVANIAHGMGAILGALIGWAVVAQSAGRIMACTMTALLVLLWVYGATEGRAYVNLSRDGTDEAYLGYQALMDNKPQEAQRWCSRAVRIEPANAGAWTNLGIACQRLGQNDKAIDAFRSAARLKSHPIGPAEK